MLFYILSKFNSWRRMAMVWGIICACCLSFLISNGLVVSRAVKDLSSESDTSLQRNLPNKIYIQSLLSTSVEPVKNETDKMLISDQKATYDLSSSKPGEAGNIIIYGHNRKAIFANLKKVKPGTIINLINSEGNSFSYVVESSFEVNPTDITPLLESSTETLTLYTCSGFLDTKRWVVQAKPAYFLSSSD